MNATQQPRQTRRRIEPVSVRVVDGLAVLLCACGLQIMQAVRSAISDQCPKCGRPWR
ncbi:MAG: hypothetical protein ABI629_07900 [bacterium]